MKYIITESQYEKIIISTNRVWILRRYGMFKKAVRESLINVNPCRFGSFDLYETYFFEYLMDDIHQEYYLINDFDYNGIVEELKDLFYVDLTEEYYRRIKNC